MDMDTQKVLPALREYKKILSTTLDDPHFLIWGSYAAGRETSESDLDVVVVSNSFAKIAPHERTDLVIKACLKIELDIDPWAATPAELAEADIGTYIGLARETGVWVDV